MKNIAVVIHSLTVEYSIEILHGITDFFKDKDVRLIVGQIKSPHSDSGIYEYHCWANAHFLTSECIDEIIVISGSFSTFISQIQLSDMFSLFKNKPVVSIAAELHLPDCVYTRVDCLSTYRDVIKHLVEVHKCKKIGFFSANPTRSPECIDRYEAYKQALQYNHLEFDDSLVLDGFLMSSTAEKVILSTYKDADEVPFDAILCVNDLTAFGCIKGLEALGVKVPEDVKVIGFDEISQAASFSPTLSTIDQNIYMQGYNGAQIAYKKVMNDHVKQENLLFAKPLYRQSCGCIECTTEEPVYKNQDLQICKKTVEEKKHFRDSIHYFNFLDEIDNIYSMFDMVDSANTLKKLFYSMKYLMRTAGIETCAVCLYDNALELDREDDFIPPDKVNVEMFVNQKKNIEIFEPGISFNPLSSIFPDTYFDGISGFYIIQPVFSGTKQYGYILCSLLKDNFSVYNVFLKIITNAIAHAFEYTNTVFENQKLTDENKRLQNDNSDLSIKSRTDELTRVLNRRGFMELGQQAMDITLQMDGTGLVFFADMDNLKTINDTYGHKVGDIAIKAQATVLTQAMRANDVVGRLSGDEFAIIASGMKPDQIDKIRKKVQELSVIISEEKGFDFVISCSFGVYPFDKEHHNLKELLREADKNMYEEKRQKHSLRESKI